MDAVLDRVVASLGPLDGEPVALDGGITNRNFRWGNYVVRVPGKGTELLGIDRHAEAQATRLAGELGIGPEVVLDDPLVTRFIEGRPVEAAELRERVGDVRAALRTLHESGATLPVVFDPLAIVQEYAETARAHGVEPPAAYGPALERARMLAVPYDAVPCHNDLLAANFLQDASGRLRILDWEYAGMGDRLFDLGNFAVNNGVSDEALGAGTLNRARFLSDFREAMWGVLQSAISDIDFDFDGYAATHFERLHAAR